jgi:hypothetical protein
VLHTLFLIRMRTVSHVLVVQFVEIILGIKMTFYVVHRTGYLVKSDLSAHLSMQISFSHWNMYPIKSRNHNVSLPLWILSLSRLFFLWKGGGKKGWASSPPFCLFIASVSSFSLDPWINAMGVSNSAVVMGVELHSCGLFSAFLLASRAL